MIDGKFAARIKRALEEVTMSLQTKNKRSRFFASEDVDRVLDYEENLNSASYEGALDQISRYLERTCTRQDP